MILEVKLKLCQIQYNIKTYMKVFLCVAEMGANRATDPSAGPLPGNFSLHRRVKGQDGALQ